MGEFLGDADVIIVGSGPAGSSTALHLARLSPELAARTLVLEKGRHPREKICGGALTLNGERIVQELGIPLNIPYTPVHHVRLVYGAAQFDLPEDGCAKRVVRRCDFDHLLFRTVKERGIATQESVRVVKVVRQPDNLAVITEHGHYLAKVVVSADGVNAVLRKTTGFGRGKLCRIYEIETPADPARELVFREQVLLIDMSYVREGLRGYYWDFPCHIGGRPYVSRGIVAGSSFGTHAFLEEILARRGVALDGALRKTWPTRHFDPREHFSQPRMLLVGDAMGTDPLFSEGISQGLACGRLAAEAIVEAFARSDLSFSGFTNKVLNSRLGRELVAYSRAARVLYGRHAELMLSLLHESDELRNLIGHSYAGTADIHQSIAQILALLAKHWLRFHRPVRRFRALAAMARHPGTRETQEATARAPATRSVS
jgi:flavin-dependent dehydrogenase